VDEVLISPTTRLPLARVLLLPLDITSSHLLPFSSYIARIDPAFSIDRPSVPTAKTPLTHFTSAFLRRTRRVMRAYGKDAMELHDITAVWAAIAYPPGLEGSAKGWTVRRRLFQMERYAMPNAFARNNDQRTRIHRIGELTRGMCVVDRRDDQGAYAPGLNRVRVQAELKSRMAAGSASVFGSLESVAVPARVEVEDEPSRPSSDEQEGVPAIECTPGAEALLQIMMKRIWHVMVDKGSLTADLLLV
jgi:hypothetical protein